VDRHHRRSTGDRPLLFGGGIAPGKRSSRATWQLRSDDERRGGRRPARGHRGRHARRLSSPAPDRYRPCNRALLPTPHRIRARRV